MKSPTYHADDLERFLIRNVIATMSEIQDFLGTPVYKTVLRKLKQLSYRSSYSHGSRSNDRRRPARDHRNRVPGCESPLESLLAIRGNRV